jgi:hypothetical protein
MILILIFGKQINVIVSLLYWNFLNRKYRLSCTNTIIITVVIIIYKI